VTDDRYLSQMSLRIFRAGLKHSLVDAKWPAFEEVFQAFEPHRVRAMSDEALEALLADTRLIRHWGKLKSVRDNAAAMIAIAEEHGSFGAWLANWPEPKIVELWEALAKSLARWAATPVRPFCGWGRKGYFYSDALGDRRAEAMGSGRGTAEDLIGQCPERMHRL
jgi:3-methyladenine DNA glycosylase Tag